MIRFITRIFITMTVTRILNRILNRLLPILIVVTVLGIVGSTRVQADANPCAGSGKIECQAGAPAVTPIPIAWSSIKQYSFSKVGPGTLIYNAPNGSVVGGFPQGFSFIPLVKTQDGFGQMMDGRWVELSSLTGEGASPFAGVTIPGALPYQLGWVLLYTKPSATPGGPSDKSLPSYHRYDRVYIYQIQHSGQWDWFEVGPGQWIDQRRVARAVPASRPGGSTNKWVSVDLYEQVLTAYEGNTMVFSTMIASGLAPNWRTHTGVFNVWHRAISTPMYGDMGGPDFYNLPYVPFVMFFDNSISLHGTYWHDGFGYEHSHGCVNMSISDAKWIFNWSADTPTMTVQVIAGP